MIRINEAVKNIIGDSLVDLIDEGDIYDNGYFELWTDPKPESIVLPPAGTLLATINFSNPAFGDFVGGLASANTIAGDLSIDNSGVATWFRVYDRNGAAVLDGDISAINGASELKLNTTSLVAGGVVQISSFTIRVVG